MNMETSNSATDVSQHSSTSFKMKEIVEVISEYIKNRSESNAHLLNKFFQAYIATIDVSVYNPDDVYCAQFYVSVYELFKTVDPQSNIAWNCVDILTNACRNSHARIRLVESYQFVPVISRMLTTELDSSNKKRVLVLLQHLTCGIKLSYEMSYLPYLFKILCQFIEDDDQNIVCLSLSIICNLCFKNISAVSTLTRITDIKELTKFCMRRLQGSSIQLQLCKLLIIINRLYDDSIPRKTLLNLVQPTCESILESLRKNDTINLKSTIDFFIDTLKAENVEVFKEYTEYVKNIHALIDLINSRKKMDPNVTPIPPWNLDAIAYILKFIYIIESNKLANLSVLYQEILNFIIEWIPHERVTYQASLLLKLIIVNLDQFNNSKSIKILNELSPHLDFLLNLLQRESNPVNMEGYKRLGALLQLNRVICKAMSKKVELKLDEQLLTNLFAPVLSDDMTYGNLPQLNFKEENTTTTDYVNAYIHAVGLVFEVSQEDTKWLGMLLKLMESRNVHSLLAMGLAGGDSEVKQVVLELSKSPMFPTGKVAHSMENMDQLFYKKHYMNHPPATTPAYHAYPLMSYNQMENLDVLLKEVQTLIREHNISNISVSQVMELYESKLAALTQSEFAASNVSKAASEKCITLQHRLSQLSSVHNKFCQTIRQYEINLQTSKNDVNKLGIYLKEEQEKSDKELKLKEKMLHDLSKKLGEVNSKLEQSEQLLETKEQQLKTANSDINNLNNQIKRLKQMLEQKESKLVEVTGVLETITRMAASQSVLNGISS
ncbi:unnamed protein product [Phyllotreta striolata]|uniref:Protein CIP2A n=1 Tax=Phyllotreta striolata TaxID=444603 RepID=A0A9N9TQY9_PHYSR|nr:unnamed protein product [Phyllotreta striolata]